MSTLCGIYMLKHNPSGAFYVGTSVNLSRRAREHVRAIRDGRGACPRVVSLANSTGNDPNQFAFSTLLICEPDDRKFFEDRALAVCHAKSGCLNSMKAGNVHSEDVRERIATAFRGKSGRPHTTASLAKMSAAQKGRPLAPAHLANVRAGNRTESHRKAMSIAKSGERNHFFGKSFTAEHRAKLTASHRTYQSAETRAKISAAKMGSRPTNLRHDRLGRFMQKVPVVTERVP